MNVKNFIKDHKDSIIITALVGLCSFCWYKAGAADMQNRIGNGLNMVFVADPTIKTSMLDAMKKVKSITD